MKTLSCLRDLEEFGIIPLTGEADNLGFRILCDLTLQGVKIIDEVFGFQAEKVNRHYAMNWNHGSDENPHVASIMLGDNSWQDIAVIALLESGCHTVIVTDQSIHGLEADEELKFIGDLYKLKTPDYEQFIQWPTCYGHIQRIIRRNPSHPSQGYRNVHAMSGRTS